MRTLRIGLVLSLAMGAAFSAPAYGDSSEAAARARAKEHNAKARGLFHLGQFEEAAAEYKKAYEARPAPAFLFNMAQCHQRLGGAAHLKQSLLYFESYLRSAPNAPNRAEVEETMTDLRAKLATLRAAEPRPTPGPGVVPVPEAATSRAVTPTSFPAEPRRASTPIYKRWWFWTGIGLVTAGLVTGLAVGLKPGDAAPAMGSMPPGQVQLQLSGR